MELSVIVPCYNESANINEFYNDLKNHLKKEKLDSYEILFVNDGSSDDTVDKIKDIIKKDKDVKLISFSRNFGKESAMLAGLKNVSGKYISIMDADMQHKPSFMLSMYNKLKDNKEYDIVCAYRDNRDDEGSTKRTLTALFYKINNLVSYVKLLPGASDFRVFKACVKDALIPVQEKSKFLKGAFSWVGFNTIYMPYTPEKRVHGTSTWSIYKLLKYSLGGIISFSNKPLKAIFICSLAITIIALSNFLLLGRLANKTIILLLGLIFLSLGIIALYLSKMYSNNQNRPNYIIKEKIGFTKTTK